MPLIWNGTIYVVLYKLPRVGKFIYEESFFWRTSMGIEYLYILF